MIKTLNHDQRIGIILFLFSLFFYFVATPLGVPSAQEGFGQDPAFMPNLIAIMLGFFGLLLVFHSHVFTEGEDARPATGLFPSRTLITIALFVAYIIITPILGYLPATALALLCYLLFWGFRRPVAVAILTVTVPLVLYWFFAKVMLVMLPQGILFE